MEIIGNLLEQNTQILTSHPSTLSHLNPGLYPNEQLIPPFIQISHDISDLERGVYIVRSGIEGNTISKLEGILEIFKKRNFRFYSANPQENEIYAHETVISNPAIEYVIGRTGLSTVYLATQHEKPLVTFPFQPSDDFEIWHNEKTFYNPKHPLVLMYKGDESFLEHTEEVKDNIEKLNSSLEQEFGTRDGIDYGTNLIYQALA